MKIATSGGGLNACRCEVMCGRQTRRYVNVGLTVVIIEVVWSRSREVSEYRQGDYKGNDDDEDNDLNSLRWLPKCSQQPYPPHNWESPKV